MYLSIDIETYNSNDLAKSGVYKYTEAPDFTILLFAYAINFGEVEIIDLTEDALPQRLIDMLQDNRVIKTAYNAQFERVCLSKFLGVHLMPEQWRCTMVQAMYNGLPGSLDNAASALGGEQKDKRGKDLIRFFSVPCKPTKANGMRTRNLPVHAPDKWQIFKEYCKQDVATEMSIADKTIPIPDLEQKLYALDQHINDAGILVDEELVQGALYIDEVVKNQVTTKMQEETELQNPKSNAQFKAWVEEQIGRPLESIDKAAVAELLEEFNGTELAAVLRLKQQVSKSSTAKYTAIENCKCADGRIRGLLQFYGGNRTGRWAGRLVQVQNLPQNHLPDLDLARDLVKTKDYKSIELLYGSPQNVLSQLIRTALIAPTGKTFIVTDFSAIEARVIAWLAGEKWRQEVFAKGGDIYCASASQMFKVPVEKHGQNSHLRQKGKIAELALGYNGGTVALVNMGAEKMGLTQEEMQDIVAKWRQASPNIARLWKKINAAAINAIKGQHSTIQYGIRFQRISKDLVITLANGRRLYYRECRIGENRFGSESIIYKDKSAGSKGGWCDNETYGGKLTENIVQATARDCLALAMLRLDAAGYKIIMHIHDEVVLEVPKTDNMEAELNKANEILATPISWAPGLILRGDGYVTDYYKKD